MRVLSTPESDCTDKTLNCQQAHVLRTRHWTGSNLWSPHPVLEAQLLDMDARQWPQLEELLHALLKAVALPDRFRQCLPGINGRGTVVVEASEAALGRSLLAAGAGSCRRWSRLSVPSNGGRFGRIRHVIDEECSGPSTACIAMRLCSAICPPTACSPRAIWCSWAWALPSSVSGRRKAI